MSKLTRAINIFQIMAVLAFGMALSACGGSSTSSSEIPAATGAAAAAEVTTTPTEDSHGTVDDFSSNRAHWRHSSTVAFSSAQYAIAQNAGAAILSVTRIGNAAAPASISYSTSDDTAVAGTDYNETSGTLQWAENDSTSKTISIPVSNTAPFAGTKSLAVTLSDPSSAAAAGAPDVAMVTISGDATVAVGSLKLSGATYTVAQSAFGFTVTVNRSGGSGGAVSVDYATANGTAVAGTDYSAANGVLHWDNGDASAKKFTIPVSNAKPFSGSKTFIVTLSNPGAGATFGTPKSASMTIIGDAAAAVGSLSLSAPSYTAPQNAGAITVPVNRIGGSNGAVSATYSASNGTAIAGTDFTLARGTLNWASGDTSAKTFKVAVSNANPFSGNKTLTVALSSPTGGTTISNPGSASVTITGDAAPGTLGLSAATFAVAQSAGTATVTVNRTGGTNGAVSAVYATSNGTAVSGTDYTPTSGTLNWANGDSTAKTFTAAISNATPFSGTKSFAVALSAPGGGATLSTPSNATVSIAGDAVAAVGELQLSATKYSVAQSAGTIAVTVNRTGGSSGAISVGYATTGGTAVAATDYTTATGTLDWANGDATSKTFTVEISNAKPFAGSKAFSVTLSGPSGGATLSTPSTAGVTINGSGGAASGGPSAVSNLMLINQGGPANSVNYGQAGSLTNYQQISWGAANPGANPIASYNVYRNGVLYANTTALTYADTNAPNSNVLNWASPATVYSYNVAAVDTQGNIGPLASQMSMYGYRNGKSNWSNADLTYGGAVTNYVSAAGNPQGGTYDVATVFAVGGGFLPTANAPECPEWDCEIGAFNYLIIDINPGPVVSPYVQLIVQARLPPGDDGSWANGYNVFNYGPAPVANTWATYKIPLKALHVGISTFTGSISGTKLTVTAVSSQGMGAVDADGYVTGPGVPAGTYVTAYNQAGSIGTFTIAGPGINSGTSVPSETMTFQRTNLYKFGLQPNTDPVTMYWNNFGFTVN